MNAIHWVLSIEFYPLSKKALKAKRMKLVSIRRPHLPGNLGRSYLDPLLLSTNFGLL